MEIIVGGHYKLLKKIGAGSFGEVYLGEDVQEHEKVAIKLEPVKIRAPQLIYESKLYLLFAGGICVPRLHWFGTESNYNVMIIDYLGKSLEDLFQMCNQRFSLKTVLMIADQCISALQYIHHKSFIHRDVKPDNFLIGSGKKSSQIFIIDFGLSKKYRDPKTLEHMKYQTGKSLTGTARYASINALKGYEQSRRDDIESLAYCLLYFMRGNLPWMGLDAKDRKQKYERIRDVKNSTKIEDLCRNIPEEFAIFLQKVRALDFVEEPDYAGYRKMFYELFIRKGYVYDYQYDWVPLFNNRRNMHRTNPEMNQDSGEHRNPILTTSNAAQISVRTPEVNDEEEPSHIAGQTYNNDNNKSIPSSLIPDSKSHPSSPKTAPKIPTGKTNTGSALNKQLSNNNLSKKSHTTNSSSQFSKTKPK
ncbi:hypothetical protein M9Y10_021535 [Tritrichomonas musculus]|uniref:non-specific serine/threonine protein kinase n=1 Tax=Tritrichomonas musculus TaxID=1915356 RepID=A0ABR2KT23_9EUKA